MDYFVTVKYKTIILESEYIRKICFNDLENSINIEQNLSNNFELRTDNLKFLYVETLFSRTYKIEINKVDKSKKRTIEKVYYSDTNQKYNYLFV